MFCVQIFHWEQNGELKVKLSLPLCVGSFLQGDEIKYIYVNNFNFSQNLL